MLPANDVKGTGLFSVEQFITGNLDRFFRTDKRASLACTLSLYYLYCSRVIQLVRKVWTSRPTHLREGKEQDVEVTEAAGNDGLTVRFQKGIYVLNRIKKPSLISDDSAHVSDPRPLQPLLNRVPSADLSVEQV